MRRRRTPHFTVSAPSEYLNLKLFVIAAHGTAAVTDTVKIPNVCNRLYFGLKGIK
jgi:hypothetical protein